MKINNIKWLFTFAIICLYLFVYAQKRTIKHSSSAIYSYKTRVDENTETLIKYFNQLIINSNDEESIDNKNEAFYKAKKLFFPKKENLRQDIIIDNFLNDLNIDSRNKLSSSDFLEVLKGYTNIENISLLIDEKNTSGLYYNDNFKNYLIKTTILLNAEVVDENGEEKQKLSRELDVIYVTASDNNFYIKSIGSSTNDVTNGYSLISPIADENNLPGANVIFKVKPVNCNISIDGNNIDYLFGEKYPIEVGKHNIEINIENDEYESIEPFDVWVKSDTDNIIIERKLVLKKGTLTIVPESECGFNANSTIFKKVYITKTKGIGKRKHEIQKSQWIEVAKRKLPFDIELEPGQYKYRIEKYPYIAKPKKDNFFVAANNKFEYSIKFIDIQSKISPGSVRCSVCNIGKNRGDNCGCCYGSGRCEMCKGSGRTVCRCCNGLGQFTLNSKDYKTCSMCNGEGKISCNHCNGNGGCCACGGDGRW